MPNTVAIIPCEAYFSMEIPPRLVGPAFVFGDEFGLPEEIEVLVAAVGLGQSDAVHVELADTSGVVVAMSNQALFEVPLYNVAGFIVVTLPLVSLTSLGRYNLRVVSLGRVIGACDVEFREVSS